MATIRNTNEAYGDPVEFSGETLEEAVAEMQTAVRACGPEFENATVTDADYEILRGTIDAAEFAASISHPVFFYAGNGAPAGVSLAILDEDCADNLPILLGELEGVVNDGVFEATNLSDGPGPWGWRFTDERGNTIYKVEIFSDRLIFERQRRDYESY